MNYIYFRQMTWGATPMKYRYNWLFAESGGGYINPQITSDAGRLSLGVF